MLRWPLRTLIYKSLIHNKKPHQVQFNNIYTDLECLIGRTDECNIILKIHLQQKRVNMLHQVFQFLQCCHLKA